MSEEKVEINIKEVRPGYYCYKCEAEFKEPVKDNSVSISERCPECASSLIRRGGKVY